MISQPADTGPIYTETHFDRLIVEPFNALSAFLFIVLVIYWLWRIRHRLRDYLFMAIALPILLIGGIGGTFYHAFRNSELFLVMDWLPIMLLTLSTSGYFIYLLTGSWWRLLLVIAALFGLQWLNFNFIPRHLAINVSYIFMATMLVLPLFLFLRKTTYANSRLIFLALLSFSLAIFFRIVDPYAWLPMGTHFLWHLFGALACHFVLAYLFRLRLTDFGAGH